MRASDATSGLAHIEYLLYPTADPADPYTPAADAPWVCDLTPDEDGSIAIPFTGDFRGLVFLRATDVAGNQPPLSYPLLVDLTPPVIAGVQNGISIGQFAPQQVGGSVNLTLPTTGETAEYTLVAVGLAGNLTEYKVTTQPVSDIPAPIEEVTPDNVSGDHRADIESVKEKAEEIHRDPDATPAQKEELEDLRDQLEEALKQVEEVEALEEAVRQLPDDLRQADPDALADLRERYSQLNDRQRERMDPQPKAKLLGGDTADTGDDASPALWGLLMAIGALGLAAAKKRRRDA